MMKQKREREREKGYGRDILDEEQTEWSNEPLAIPILSSDSPLSDSDRGESNLKMTTS